MVRPAPAEKILTRRLVVLGRDRRSGAAEIAGAAWTAFRTALAARVPAERIARAGARLILAQPAMAPLVRLANDACLGTLGRRRREGTFSLGAVLPRRAARLATYSNSSTVRRALVSHRARIELVFCSESRPGGEGVALARALGRARVPVTLLGDAALRKRLDAVDLVLVGADAIASNGVINKAGTRALAGRARRAGTPFYVLAGREKLLPPRLARFLRIPPRFDRTPFALVSGLLTAEGPLARTQALREMKEIEVSPLLVETLRRLC